MTLTILIESGHVVAGQTISAVKVVRLVIMNTVNPLAEGRNPKSIFAIAEQHLNFQLAAIQFARYKWLPHALEELLKSFARQIHSNPLGAVIVGKNVPYARNSLPRFQFLYGERCG